VPDALFLLLKQVSNETGKGHMTLIEMQKAGVPFVFVELRGIKVDVIKYVNKQDGKAQEFTKHYLCCETLQGDQLQVNLREPFSGAKKGDKLVVGVNGYERENGRVTVFSDLARVRLAVKGEIEGL